MSITDVMFPDFPQDVHADVGVVLGAGIASLFVLQKAIDLLVDGKVGHLILSGGAVINDLPETAFFKPLLAPYLEKMGLPLPNDGEKEADYMGLQYLYKSGYDPTAFVDFFEKVQTMEKKKPGTMAKVFATEAANKVCDVAVQVHGGYGYIDEFPVERHFRKLAHEETFAGSFVAHHIYRLTRLRLGRRSIFLILLLCGLSSGATVAAHFIERPVPSDAASAR